MKQIKSQAETRHIPVHIISSQDIEPKVALENGAFNFTNKPISESGLKNLFDSISEVTLKQNGKVILFYDKEEQMQAVSSFLLERNIEPKTFKLSEANQLPSDYSEVDAVIIDIDSRKSAIPNLLEQLKGKIKANTMPVIVLNNTYLSTLDQRKIKNYQSHFILKITKSYQGILEEMSMFLNFISRDLSLKKMRPPIVSAKVLENKTILLVDDDNENRFSISKIIELQNANVLHAVNGKDALEKFVSAPVIDAVLMDIMMPEMDGYEAMRELRKMDKGKTVPIIALTAKTQADERENCLKNGASDYMPKPIDADLLISLLKVWINQSLK